LSDIFQEIDEDLKRDRLAKLWARYRLHAVGLLVAVVVGISFYTAWTQYELTQRQAEGVRFAAALDRVRAGDDQGASSAFADLAANAGGGHAVLAKFEEAAAKARLGDTAGALALYDQISSDNALDSQYRDAATILFARASLGQGDAKPLIDRLKPLTDAANPWHGFALEFTALAQLQSGDKDSARQTYQTLAADQTVPAGTRARASQMLAALGS
jgi:hypothetical protein